LGSEVAIQGYVRILKPTRPWSFVFGPSHFSSVLLVAVGLAAFSTSSIAAPREEITQALTAGGAADAASAPKAVFLRAFTAVAVRIKVRDLPEYAAAAIQIRPDLAAKIIAASTKIMARNPQGLSCAALARLVKVTIASNPDCAVAITAAAIKARPQLSHCIIAAAGEAAPDQQAQIARLENYFSLALLSWVTDDSEAAPWHGSGSLNPANIVDLRKQNPVISPEQPPAP
jgi:hypothetical protein